MKYPLYKEWMGEKKRLSDNHIAGIREFIEYALVYSKGDIFSCPCTKCRNGRNRTSEDVELHLLKWGMDQSYTYWCFHGERRESPYVPSRVRTRDSVQDNENKKNNEDQNDMEGFGQNFEDRNCHPSIVNELEQDKTKAAATASSQDKPVNLDTDVLSKCSQKDKAGRKRSAGSQMSNLDKRIQTLQTFFNKKKAEDEKLPVIKTENDIRAANDRKFREISSRLDILERKLKDGR